MTRVYFVYWQTLFDNSVFVFLGCFAVLLPMLEKKLPLQDSLNQAFTEGMCMHRAKRGCRGLVFSQSTWITICSKFITGFLLSDTKIRLPSPALSHTDINRYPVSHYTQSKVAGIHVKSVHLCCCGDRSKLKVMEDECYDGWGTASTPLRSTVSAQPRKRATCGEQEVGLFWFSLRQRSNSVNSEEQPCLIFWITGCDDVHCATFIFSSWHVCCHVDGLEATHDP